MRHAPVRPWRSLGGADDELYLQVRGGYYGRIAQAVRTGICSGFLPPRTPWYAETRV